MYQHTQFVGNVAINWNSYILRWQACDCDTLPQDGLHFFGTYWQAVRYASQQREPK